MLKYLNFVLYLLLFFISLVLCFAYLQHLSVGPYVPKCSKRSALQPLPHQLVPGILTDVDASDLVLRRKCAGPERVDGILNSKF